MARLSRPATPFFTSPPEPMTRTANVDISITGRPTAESGRVLTSEALAFLGQLQKEFGARRAELLERRHERWASLQVGGTLSFATDGPAQGDWRVAPAP